MKIKPKKKVVQSSKKRRKKQLSMGSMEKKYKTKIAPSKISINELILERNNKNTEEKTKSAAGRVALALIRENAGK